MATIKDVARLAGTAVSTVSKYINGGRVRPQNAEAIRQAIEQLDFRVNPFARNLKNRRSQNIGVLMPDITSAFWGNLLTALDRVLREAEYNTLIACYDANHGLERDKLQFLLGAGIDGLIYIPDDLTAQEFDELAGSCGIPVVLLDRAIAGVSTDTVLTNNSDATYQAVSRLLDDGHQRVGILTGPESVFTAKERLVGYLRALSDHNILYDESLVLSGENTFAFGYQGLNRLLTLPNPPTAILATNYDITVGSISAARELRLKVPGDLSIFGYDCAKVCTLMSPPMPVVIQPEAEMGKMAGKYMIQRLQGSTVPPRVTRLDCKIIY